MPDTISQTKVSVVDGTYWTNHFTGTCITIGHADSADAQDLDLDFRERMQPARIHGEELLPDDFLQVPRHKPVSVLVNACNRVRHLVSDTIRAEMITEMRGADFFKLISICNDCNLMRFIIFELI